MVLSELAEAYIHLRLFHFIFSYFDNQPKIW